MRLYFIGAIDRKDERSETFIIKLFTFASLQSGSGVTCVTVTERWNKSQSLCWLADRANLFYSTLMHASSALISLSLHEDNNNNTWL